MCKGLGQQSANARYNLMTNLLDVALLWLLLPRWGMGGYYFKLCRLHLVNFALSLGGWDSRRACSSLRARRCGRFSLRRCRRAAGFLLRPQAGAAGALVPMGCYLLALGALWLAFRVVGRRDALWLKGLVGAGRNPGADD